MSTTSSSTTTTNTYESSYNNYRYYVDFYAFLTPGLHPGMDALARGLTRGVQERGGLLRLRIVQEEQEQDDDIDEEDTKNEKKIGNNDNVVNDDDDDDAVPQLSLFDRQILRSVHNNKLQQVQQEQNLDAPLPLKAIYLFITNPNVPSKHVVDRLIQNGICIYTIHRPWYPVCGCIVVPNYYQGVSLANRLTQELYHNNNTSNSTNDGNLTIRTTKKYSSYNIVIIGGPQIVDDEELVLGCLDGCQRSGCINVVNDPFENQWRNLKDTKNNTTTFDMLQRLLEQ